MTATTDTPSSSPTARRIATAILMLAATLNLWLVTRGWRSNLLDAHEFRQVQTAITAYYFRQDGVRLDYETPILGAPWSIPMEFPTYQACVAWLSRATGMPLEQAGRCTSIFFFYAGLPALYLLLRRWKMPVEAAMCAVVAVLTSPLYAFYSRTFMIESTALCFSLWFLFGFWDTLHGSRWRGLALAWIFGSLAILTKVTTFAVFGVPAFVTGLGALRDAWPEPRYAVWRRLGWCVLAAAPILLLGFLWVRHSDHLKQLNPYAAFITSTSLREWNLGTLAQRFSADFWQTIHFNISKNILGEPAQLLLFAGLPLLAREGRLRVLLCLLSFSGGFLLFSNLYHVHDYYYYGSALFLLAAFGMVAGGVLRETRLPWLTRALLVGGILLGTQYAAFDRGYGNFYRRPNPAPLPLAEIIRQTTARDDVVVVFGLDWNGQLAYYSQRRTIMVPHHRLDDAEAFQQALANLGTRRVAAMVVAGNLKNSPHFTRPHLQQLEMGGTPVAETDNMALYLRSDLHAGAIGQLKGSNYPGVQLARRPLALDMKETHQLDTPAWRERLGMMQPAPQSYQSIFPLSFIDLDGEPVVNAHAPTELYFHPPTGARHIRARGGLLPTTYTDGNATDGIILQVFEETAPGQRHLLYERPLRPLERILDREPAVIEVDADHPFEGRIVFRIDPGPAGSVNFDWAYWSRVEIR